MKHNKQRTIPQMNETEIMQVTGGLGIASAYNYDAYKISEIRLTLDADRPHRPLIPKKKPTKLT